MSTGLVHPIFKLVLVEEMKYGRSIFAGGRQTTNYATSLYNEIPLKLFD
jgi:hypothetical protein